MVEKQHSQDAGSISDQITHSVNYFNKGKIMQKINFPYRSSSHLSFLHVVGESGSWEKHGLDVNYDFGISAGDAHRAVADGSIEFVGGNHVSTYSKRAHGDRWVYLAQTMNILNHALIVRQDSGINGVADLKGKKVGTFGSHPGLNDWLFLKQNGLDEDRGDVTFERKVVGKKDLDFDPDALNKETPLDMVLKGKVDAYFVTAPADLFARRVGLKVIAIDPLPMIWFTTVSSGMPFVDKHPDIVEKFLKGLIEGIAYLKTHRAESIKIIQSKYKEGGDLDTESATHLYDELARAIEAKPYPTLEAIRNVYLEALHQDPTAKRVNPMELWNMHHLRRIDDSGFIDALYTGIRA
jgi:ABC-type nitrate/sulfonate/bicarbonate transport system substrate-binding protein